MKFLKELFGNPFTYLFIMGISFIVMMFCRTKYLITRQEIYRDFGLLSIYIIIAAGIYILIDQLGNFFTIVRQRRKEKKELEEKAEAAKENKALAAEETKETTTEEVKAETTKVIKETTPEEVKAETAEVIEETTPEEVKIETTEVIEEPTTEEIKVETTEVIEEPTPEEVKIETTEVIEKPTPEEVKAETTEVIEETTPEEVKVETTEVIEEPTSKEEESVATNEEERASVIYVDREITLIEQKLLTANVAIHTFMTDLLTPQEVVNLKKHISNYIKDKSIDESIIITNGYIVFNDVSNFGWIIGCIFGWKRSETAPFIGKIFSRTDTNIQTMEKKLLVRSKKGKIQGAAAQDFIKSIYGNTGSV